MKNHQSGFTLIEIAIVLVIIGLLLTGVIKGQELMDNAKIKNLAADFRNAPSYIFSYQDKFRALPGDDASVAAHLSGASTASTPANSLGNGLINGAWNSTTSTDESFLFWQHIRLANLAAGATAVTASDYQPRNALGGVIGVQSGTSDAAATPVKDAASAALKGTYVVCSAGIPGKLAKLLDTQLDDGETSTGRMLATATSGYTAGAAASTSANIDEASAYTVCMGV